MVLLFTCGMKAHTPVMYTGSEQSWNEGREGKRMSTWGGSTDSPPKLLDMFKKFNTTHASAFGSV